RDMSVRSAIKPRVMLHIAQPENVEPWFADATKAGVTDFDLIGISYYRKWSTQSMAELGKTIRRLRGRYDADVVVVETAYPWTLDSGDTSHNLLGEDSLIAGYPATPQGQARYMVDLTQLVIDTGGAGVVYWEPAWTSSHCKTRWGTGSSWENASFFDFKHGNEVLPAIDFMRHPYTGVPASRTSDAGKHDASAPESSVDAGKRTQP
ncbi:arabinogalactan endo-1,4-beta-galactosidase, partial [Xanthomonas perforans]